MVLTPDVTACVAGQPASSVTDGTEPANGRFMPEIREGDRFNQITSSIIESAIRIHRVVGPGLLESAYAACLVYELSSKSMRIEVQKPLPLSYRGVVLDCAYRADVVVENSVLVEVKAIESLAPVHVRQVFTYVRIGRYPVGLLLNFGTATMKDGIKRVVNGFPD